jgi:hypothetical protein
MESRPRSDRTLPRTGIHGRCPEVSEDRQQQQPLRQRVNRALVRVTLAGEPIRGPAPGKLTALFCFLLAIPSPEFAPAARAKLRFRPRDSAPKFDEIQILPQDPSLRTKFRAMALDGSCRDRKPDHCRDNLFRSVAQALTRPLAAGFLGMVSRYH